MGGWREGSWTVGGVRKVSDGARHVHEKRG